MRTADPARRMLKASVLAAALLTAPAYSQQSQQPRFPLPPADWPKPVMDQHVYSFVLIDRLEQQWGRDENEQILDAQGWIGGDYNRFWWKTEVERTQATGVNAADVELLYARLLTPFWYLQAGLRTDIRPQPIRNAAVLGFQGLAPYLFNVEGAMYLRAGNVAARFEAEYDVLVTQRWVLQPRVEFAYAGTGFAEEPSDRMQLGLRLRYEIRREFAPYVGVTWTRRFADAADRARAAGVDVSGFGVVAGVRIWY